MKSEWITLGETRILHADVSDFGRNLDGLGVELEELAVVVMQEPQNSIVMLIDLQNTELSMQAVRLLKDGVPKMRPHISKRAIVVTKITGFKKVIFDGIAKLVKNQAPILFEDIEKAKDWLANHK